MDSVRRGVGRLVACIASVVFVLAAGAAPAVGRGAERVAATARPVDSVAAQPHTAGGEVGQRPQAVRLGGASRYDTAAAVVRWRAAGEIPAGSRVLLVSGTEPLLAVAHGGDGRPMLFVPPSGPVPDSVRAAYRAISPAAVEVVGSLSDAQVRAVVGRPGGMRQPQTDPVAASWRRALDAARWASDDEMSQLPVTVFAPAAVIAQAAAAVQWRGRYVVITPERGPLPPSSIRTDRNYPDPAFMHPVTVVGGTTAISNARRAELLRGQRYLENAEFKELAGPDRYATAALLARQAYPDGARTAYLVNGVGGVDAAATVSLIDGPVFLVPPCGPLPKPVLDGLRELKPERIAAIGDTSVVCDAMLRQAVDSTVKRDNTTATSVAIRGDSVCLADAAGVVQCFGRAPRPIVGQRAPAASVTAGMAGSMCAIGRDSRLWCWELTAGGNGPIRTIAGPPTGVAQYAATWLAGCARGVDGSVWCHETRDRGGQMEQTELAPIAGLPKARSLAVGETSACVLGVDASVWCWALPATTRPSSAFSPYRVALGAGVVAESISLRESLMVRSPDESVRLIGLTDRRRASAPTRLPVPARSLLPGTSCYFAAADGRLVCPYNTDPPPPEGTVTFGVRQVVMTWGTSCVIRAAGSVSCWAAPRDHGSPGNIDEWASLGDGIYGPRYRPADVLGFR